MGVPHRPTWECRTNHRPPSGQYAAEQHHLLGAAWAEHQVWVAVFNASQEQIQAEAEWLLADSRGADPAACCLAAQVESCTHEGGGGDGGGDGGGGDGGGGGLH